MIYFVTVNYYSTSLISQLLNSLPEKASFKYKLVIINNSSDDQSVDLLNNENILVIDAGCNLGFGAACNLGLKWIYTQDTNAVVWIINPDTYFIENPFPKLDSFFTEYPEISILGTIIRTPGNQIWFAGGSFFPKTGTIKNVDLITSSKAAYVECDWVSGCSLIINLRNFSSCPLFDPEYFLYYEDFDFCRRYFQSGYKIAITKSLLVIHQPSSITNRFMRKKILHSTYSYLITLERYTNSVVLILRLIRLICSALMFIFIKPNVTIGKFQGILMYWHNRSNSINNGLLTSEDE